MAKKSKKGASRSTSNKAGRGGGPAGSGVAGSVNDIGEPRGVSPRPKSGEDAPTRTAAAASGPRATTRSAKRRRQQRINIAIGAGIATVIVAAIVLDRVREAGRPGERFPSQGNVHLAALVSPHVPYNSNPPTSGPHMPGIAQWGSYTDLAQAPDDEFLVHNMEDGGVIIWYRNGTPEENERKVDVLESISFNFRRIVIVPREDFGSEFAMTAWTRLQRFDEVDSEGMLAFIQAYEGIDHHPRQ